MSKRALPNQGTGPAVVMTVANMHAAFDPAGTEVWCPFAEREAYTNDGFCQFCGSTTHQPTSKGK